MAHTYFEVGRRIVEEEQNGKERAKYGKQIVKNLSERLTNEFGKGFSATNIRQMRSFFIVYEKQQAVPAKLDNNKTHRIFCLTWTHYLFLMRLDDENERLFYEIESYENNWSTRELKRQFDTGLYQRIVLSKDKEEFKKLIEE